MDTTDKAPNPDQDTVVHNDQRRKLLWTMMEFLQLQGATNIRARLPGVQAPSTLSGTLEDHRPDLSCRQGNAKKTSTFVDVLLFEDYKATSAALHRFTLLASAAKLYKAELHIVVSQDWPERDPEQQVRNWLRAHDIEGVVKIWVI